MMRRAAHIRIAAFLFLGAMTALSAGCGADVPKGGHVDIEGYISSLWGTSADPAPGGVLGSMLVDGGNGAGGGHDKASVKVTEKTAIWEAAGGGTRRASFEDLEVGQQVRVTFTGPVAESYPVQATAGEVVIARRTTVGEVLDRHGSELFSIRGVAGFGVSSRGGDPVILVYLESDDPALRALIPEELEGFPVVTEVTGPIEALPSQE